jgi:nucleotide-binding universal stress UspA family protein
MSPRQPPIVVGFDGSDDSKRAAEWAAALALAVPGTPLHLVHSLVLPPLPFASPGHQVESLLAEHEREARAALDAAAAALASKGLEVETFARAWLPAETVLEHANETRSGLIVVGQRGTRASRLLLGSVSNEIARAAAQPSAVVRGEPRAVPPRRVLLALDGSAPAARAAAAARHWCPGAAFLAVRVREGGDADDESALRRDLSANGFDAAALDARVLEGAPAEALLDLCEREAIDLVAAGRRGLSAWRELLLGGVSEKLAQLAPCPVLLAR